MSAPDQLRQLVDRFTEHRTAYVSGRYKETPVRRDFIDPFFKLLGWDVDNEKGAAEQYRQVVHEDAIKIGGATTAPDYAFRIGGVPKFFVEAKNPSVNLQGDIAAAFQLRRYAWTAHLPLSILTDFEEFAVYDGRVKPVKTDRVTTARIMYLDFGEYDSRWTELVSLFSPDAILRGSFDAYADSAKKKRGTAEVDDEFLKDIEDWRKLLAQNIALRNPVLTQRELNFVVQRTIDRIVFLRICEDRGIEDYGRLAALREGAEVYPRLCKLFQEADDRYNSGIFHFKAEKGRETPDELSLSVAVDDRPLKEILKRLYYPDSPYEFSVLPAEILGQVYEQFLGSVIHLTAGHHARVEQKPEVRKAGGVYYTPVYIVDYIVRNTVGRLLDGKKPGPRRGVNNLRILDPACGSGSFLIAAYQYLVDWHRDRYVEDGPEKHSKELFQGPGGEWRLATDEKKRILLNNIYGVDIDPQAVEVTKLSLLLKVLEGETQESIRKQLQLFKERALPDLGANIKCGNSLVGPDFHSMQTEMLDEETRSRVNAFDWPAEFAVIMKGGGFDAVIGNPPYVRMEAFKELKEYLRRQYASHAERADLYVYFLERAHQLLRQHGLFGMIVSNKFMRGNYGAPVRQVLGSVANVRRIVDLAGLPVFRGATVRTVVLLTERTSEEKPTLYSPPPTAEALYLVEAGIRPLAEVVEPMSYEVSRTELSTGGWRVLSSEHAALMDRIAAGGQTLKDLMHGNICMGIKSGLTEAFVIPGEVRRAILKKNPEAEEILKPFVQGRHIRRYAIEVADQFLIYTHHGIDMKPYPALIEHLRSFKARLEARATKQAWYELQQPQFAYRGFLDGPKIVFPDIATGCRFALDVNGRYGANTVYFLPTADLALLALLNSRLAHYYFKQTCAALEGPGESYLRFFGQYLEDFPVPTGSLSGTLRGKLEALASNLMDLQGQITATRMDSERATIKRQAAALDRQVDEVVYELFRLSDSDVVRIEAETSGRQAGTAPCPLEGETIGGA